MKRYRSVGSKPAEYLIEGETLVHHRETLLTLAGETLYDELAAAPSPSSSLSRHGGLSLMEMLTPWLVLGPKE